MLKIQGLTSTCTRNPMHSPHLHWELHHAIPHLQMLHEAPSVSTVCTSTGWVCQNSQEKSEKMSFGFKKKPFAICLVWSQNSHHSFWIIKIWEKSWEHDFSVVISDCMQVTPGIGLMGASKRFGLIVITKDTCDYNIFNSWIMMVSIMLRLYPLMYITCACFMKLSLKKKPCMCFSGNAAPHQVNGYNLGSHLDAGQINGERHFRRHGWVHWGTGRACYVVPPATNHQEQHKDPNKPGRCTVWVRKLNIWKVKSLLIKCQSLLHQWKVSFLPSRWSFFGVSWGFCFMGKYGKVAKNGRQIIISWFLSFSRWKIQVNNFCCTGDLVQIFHQFGPIMSSHHDIPSWYPSYPIISLVSTLDLDKKLFFLANWINLKAERAR